MRSTCRLSLLQPIPFKRAISLSGFLHAYAVWLLTSRKQMLSDKLPNEKVDVKCRVQLMIPISLFLDIIAFETFNIFENYILWILRWRWVIIMLLVIISYHLVCGSYSAKLTLNKYYIIKLIIQSYRKLRDIFSIIISF